MRHFFQVLFCILSFPILGQSQTSTCFEIQGILVDACAPSGGEGQNEMVRFLVGPNDLNTNDLNVTWATTGNAWTGVCQDASTAQKIAQLNASIVSCGYLKEPVGGILPANSKVLLVSGINMDVTANSFAGLSDTVYVIFHCSTSATGNFANFGSGIRTFSMSFNTPASCSDQVSYDRSLLVTTSGATGAEDGALVNFDYAGTANYFNYGCTAPFTQGDASWTSPGTICATAGLLDLNTLVTGTTGGTWTGTGITSGVLDPSALSGSYDITYTVGAGTCSTAVTHAISVTQSGIASFTTPGNMCSSADSIELNTLLTGVLGGNWSGPGVSNGYFNPAALSGTITLTYTAGVGSCASSAQQSFTVTTSPLPPSVTGTLIYCEGQNPQTLTANGVTGATFNWFEDEILASSISSSSSYTPIISVTDTLYVVQNNGACSSAAATVIIEVNSTPIPPLVQSPVNYCQGSLPMLNAVSSSSMTWFSDALLSNQVATGSSFQPSSNANTTYWVVAANGSCASLPAQIVLIEQQTVNAVISVVGPSVLCGGNTIKLASSYATGNSWSTGETTDTIQVNTEGTYTLSVSNACNVSIDDFSVIDATVLAAFTADPMSGAEPLSVVVTDESQNADQCNWFINDVASSIVSGTPLELMMGDYVITHICTNTAGCADTVSRTIQVISDKVEVQIPNSFTPNGDGMNELFKVKSMGITQLKAVVFNRWGSKVAEFEGVSAGWDGTSIHGASPDGVYFYIINTTDVLNQENTYKGSVTLLR